MKGCEHPVRVKDMCVICFADTTNYAEPSVPTNSGQPIVHGNLDIRVNEAEARNIDLRERERLLKENKLSLVVDLDQTVLHATVDTHIEDLMNDPSNPDYEHVKDIAKLTLIDGSYNYFIKFRPGLESFLDRLHGKYELHVYTMGSRSYATEIVKRIDPDRKYFGDRIISREDSGCGDNRKQLSRIFPHDDRTVLIIDDRADVWDYSQNLVQVPPFYFFIGTGDVNARPGMTQHVLPDVNIPLNVECKVSMSRFVRKPDHSLETIYSILEETHRIFFMQYKDSAELIPDVKQILNDLKSSVFCGAGLVFSGLTPRNSRIEDTHWWRVANQYGARCDVDLTPYTTHVISNLADTSKVLCAFQRGLHVVTPEWITHSQFNWEMLPEENYRTFRLLDPAPGPVAPIQDHPEAVTLESLGPLNLQFDELSKEIDEEMETTSSSNETDGPLKESEEDRNFNRDKPKVKYPDFIIDLSAGSKRTLSARGKEDEEDDSSVNFDSDSFVNELERELS